MPVPFRLRAGLSVLTLACLVPIGALSQDPPAPAAPLVPAVPEAAPPPADREAGAQPADAVDGEPAPDQLTDEAEQRGLTSPEVQDSLNTDPPPEGMIEPEVTEGEEQAPDLYQLLQRVRAAPPGYDGRPIPRPNPLASEPLTEMRPQQPADMPLFPDGYVE